MFDIIGTLLPLAKMTKYLPEYILQNVLLLKRYQYFKTMTVCGTYHNYTAIFVNNDQCIWAVMSLLLHSPCYEYDSQGIQNEVKQALRVVS